MMEGYFHLHLVRSAPAPRSWRRLSIDRMRWSRPTDNWQLRYQAAKHDPDFNRDDMPKPIKTAPFYAIEIKPDIPLHHGRRASTRRPSADAGPAADPRAVRGGRVTGGVHNGNRLGGNAMTALTFGPIAGRRAGPALELTRGRC